MSAKLFIIAVVLGTSLLSTSAELEQPIRGANGRQLLAPGGTITANYGQSTGEAMGVWQWSIKPPSASQAKANQMVKSTPQGTTSTYGRKLQQLLTGGNINAAYGFNSGQLMLARQWKVGQNGASYKVAPMVKSSGRKLMQAEMLPGDLSINYNWNSGQLLQASTYTVGRTGSTFKSQPMVKPSSQGAKGSIGGK